MDVCIWMPYRYQSVVLEPNLTAWSYGTVQLAFMKVLGVPSGFSHAAYDSQEFAMRVRRVVG